MGISQRVTEKLNIQLPRIPGWIKPGVVGFIAGFTVASFLNLYVVYVVVSSGSLDDILHCNDVLLFAMVVAILI